MPMQLWDLVIVESGRKVYIVPSSELSSIIPLKLLSSACILVISPAIAVEVIHCIKVESRCAIVSVQCQLRKMMMSGMVLMY